MTAHHWIKRLSVTGGFLDGLDVAFVDGLNCIIGPRGTGKTTIIELIRFALDAMPGREGDPLRKRIESLVNSNLDGGRVEVAVETKGGFTYTVNRSLGGTPIVFDQSGNSMPGMKVRGGVLFRADILSQNQIESIAEMPHYQLDLIDKFRFCEIHMTNWKISEARNALESNSAALVPLMAHCEVLKAELQELPVVEAKLIELRETAGINAEAINRAHTVKALRDQEQRAVNEAERLLTQITNTLNGILGGTGLQIGSIFTSEIMDGPNEAIFAIISAQLSEATAAYERHLKATIDDLRAGQEALAHQKSLVEEAHKKQEVAFFKLIEKNKGAQAKAPERAKVEQRRNELLFKKRQIAEIQEQISKLWKERSAISKELSHLYDERFKLRSGVAKELTDKLSPTVRVRVRQCGNRSQYRDYLEAAFRGFSIKGSVVAAKLAASVTPNELMNLIKEGDWGRVAEECNLNDHQATTVLEALNSPEQFFALELALLEDAPFIELFDRGEYRETSALSTGQKCTAILPILLFESDSPLLIDHPEDNLDNRYIYETVVETLREIKKSRQLIFVTQNPNIPVLGDAGLVLAMGSDKSGTKITHQGNVDECREDIVVLLEGGEEAFKARKKRYHY